MTVRLGNDHQNAKEVKILQRSTYYNWRLIKFLLGIIVFLLFSVEKSSLEALLFEEFSFILSFEAAHIEISKFLKWAGWFQKYLQFFIVFSLKGSLYIKLWPKKDWAQVLSDTWLHFSAIAQY